MTNPTKSVLWKFEERMQIMKPKVQLTLSFDQANAVHLVQPRIALYL
jgi:hypothetical protein